MNSRVRAKSVSSALANLSKPTSLRRSHSATIEITPRSVRVVILGSGGVGKTAMIVRFVTKRFIGDYDPTLETIYRHTTLVDDHLVNFELMDTTGQGEKTLLLEDKCKWGESFVFVYDVTDRYSFDELTRLKFIASYTHSRLRVNFTPCWVLVGNKADLADRERMVSTKEGESLARDLGCHIFREISVKESMMESTLVFEELWREFLKMSPRSPSSSQRRKFSTRIQDKIPVLDSHSCSCNSEASKHNPSTSSSVPTPIKRHSIVNYTPLIRQTKDGMNNDPNNNEETKEASRNCPCIPEHNEEQEEEKEDDLSHAVDEKQRRSFLQNRSRRSAIVSEQHGESKSISFPLFNRRKTISKSISFENVFNHIVPTSPTETSHPLTSSSRSSSSSSLSGVSPGIPSNGAKPKTFDRLRSSDSSSHLQSISNANQLENIYREQYCRNRTRRLGSAKLTALISPQET